MTDPHSPQAIDDHLERHWMPRLIRVWRDTTARSASNRSDHEADAMLSARELERVAKAVWSLSRGLVGERELVGGSYMDDADLLAAYLLFFWPVSYAQARRVLSQLGPSGLTGPRALDLGSGPGPMTMALHDVGATHVTAVEPSSRAIGVLSRLADTIDWSGLTCVRTHAVDYAGRAPEAHEGDYDTVIAGHMLNELWPEREDRAARRAQLCAQILSGRAREGGRFIAIEPALQHTSRDLLRVRDHLVGQGHHVYAPCLRQGECPALARERDWCHTDYDWTPPEIVARLASLSGLKKSSLKMSYGIFAASPVSSEPRHPEASFRIVSEQLTRKGQTHFVGCGPLGRMGLTRLKRDKSAQNAVFPQLERGDVIELREPERLQIKGDGVRIARDTVVDFVAGPTEAVDHAQE